MKRLYKGAALGILLSVGYLGIITGKRAVEKLFTVSQYTVTYDPLLSETVQTTITNLVAEQLQVRATVQVFVNFLQEQIPSIGSVDVRHTADAMTHISVCAAQPEYCINETYVLTARATLASCADYVPTALQELPAVAVPSLAGNNSIDLTNLKRGLDALDRSLLQTHQLTRLSETESWLRDKSSPNFALVFNDYTVLDAKKRLYAALAKERLEQGKLSGQKAAAWAIDFRFQNQIILFAEKKGVSYG